MTIHSLHLPDLTCARCVQRVRSALDRDPSVTACLIDAERREVVFDLADGAELGTVLRTLDAAGYPAVERNPRPLHDQAAVAPAMSAPSCCRRGDRS